MNLTPEKLIEIIRQEIEKVMEDFGLLMPLPAEPVGNEEPPKLMEGKSKVQLCSQLINTMSDEEKNQLFSHYKRFPWKTLLARFSEMKTAEKGAK